MRDFFISYNKSDLAWADRIASLVEGRGYTTILAHRDWPYGSVFVLRMDEAIQRSARVLAILSPAYLEAKYTQIEWALALTKDPRGLEPRLIPVRVADCTPTGMLAGIKYIDLVGLDEAEANRAFLSGISCFLPIGRPVPRQEGPEPSHAGDDHYEAALRSDALPHRNPYFTGREESLRIVYDNLSEGRARLALLGLGGVGKTQLAVEYLYAYGASFCFVGWIRAGEQVTLATDYANLAVRLDLPERRAGQAARFEAVRRWLEHNTRWLLVFDDAGAEADLWRYLPRTSAGQVLITSRRDLWSEIADSFRVPVFKRDEAMIFLRQRTGREDFSAEKLAGLVGDLPLALEQAGAYIRSSGISFSRYIELYRNSRQQMLERGLWRRDYQDTVATTWEISFGQLRNISDAAADLLHLCAYLSPEDIPLDLLRQGAVLLPPHLREVVQILPGLHDIVLELQRFFLLESGQDCDAVSVHHLVQAVCRDRCEPEAREGWIKLVMDLIDLAYASGRYDGEKGISPIRLLPHVMAVTHHAAAADVAQDSALRLLNEAGIDLQERGELDQALMLFRRALGHASSSPAAAAAVANNIGVILQKKGDLDGALLCLEKAYEINQHVFGGSADPVAVNATNLGAALLEAGDPENALGPLRSAFEFHREWWGDDHPSVAVDANNIALALKSKGDLEEALRFAKLALRIDRTSFGESYGCVATDLNTIGSILKAQGDLEAALEHFVRALEIDQAALEGMDSRILEQVRRVEDILNMDGEPNLEKDLIDRILRIDKYASWRDDQLRQDGGVEIIHSENLEVLYNSSLAIGDEVILSRIEKRPRPGLYAEKETVFDRETHKIHLEVSELDGRISILRARNVQNLLGRQGKAVKVGPIQHILSIDRFFPRGQHDIDRRSRLIHQALAEEMREEIGLDFIKRVLDLDQSLPGYGARTLVARAHSIRKQLATEWTGIFTGSIGRILEIDQIVDSRREAGVQHAEEVYKVWRSELPQDANVVFVRRVLEIDEGMNDRRSGKKAGTPAGPRPRRTRRMDKDLGETQVVAPSGAVKWVPRLSLEKPLPKHPNIARDLNNIAMVLREQGELNQALLCAQRAVEIGESAVGHRHPEMAMFRHALGRILQDLGDSKGALEEIQRALEIARATRGKESALARSIRESLMSLERATTQAADVAMAAGEAP